jgi:hypothetical protein
MEPIQTGLAPLRLFYDPPGTLRATFGDERSYPVVKLFQAWPLTHPWSNLSLQDGKGEEILMIDSMEELAPASRAVAEEELRRRYLTARIETIAELRVEFGVTYWTVTTDRGERDFVVQSLTESCVWLSERHLLVLDVDGNRFEIADRTALEPVSRARLDAVL